MLLIVCLAICWVSWVVGFLMWFWRHILLAVAVAMFAIAAIQFCSIVVSLFCSLRARGGTSRKRSSLIWLLGFLWVSLFDIRVPSTLSAVIKSFRYLIRGHFVLFHLLLLLGRCCKAWCSLVLFPLYCLSCVIFLLQFSSSLAPTGPFVCSMREFLAYSSLWTIVLLICHP